MNVQTEYKLCKFILKIQSNIQKYSIFKYLIQLLNLVWILLLIMKIISKKSCEQLQLCINTRNFILNNILTEKFLQVTFIIYNFLKISLIIITIIYVRISSNIQTNGKKVSYEKKIFLISTIFVYVSQIIFYPSLSYILIKSQGQYLSSWIVIYAILSIQYNLIHLKVSQYSLYQQWSILIIFLIWLPNNIYAHGLVLLISLYKFIRAAKTITKIFLTFIFMSIASNIYAYQVAQKTNATSKQPFVFFAILMVLVISLVIKLSQKIRYITISQYFQYIFQKTQQLPLNDKISRHFNMGQFYNINKFLIQFSNFSQNVSSKIEQTQQPLMYQQTIQNLYNHCIGLLKLRLQVHPKNNFKTFLLRLMILTNHNLSQILYQIQILSITIQKMKFNQKIVYVRILQNLKYKYAFYMDNNNQLLEISCLEDQNRNIIMFEDKLKRIIQLEIGLWEILLNQQLIKMELEKKFQELNDMRVELIEIKDSLKQNSVFYKYLLVYKQVMKDFYQYSQTLEQVQYQQKNLLQGKNPQQYELSKKQRHSSILQRQNHTISSKFLIISNQFITKVSNNLRKQLQLNANSYQGVKWKQIFSKGTSSLLQSKINSINSSSDQKKQFYIPLFISQNTFISCFCRILWYPSVQDKLKYLIKLTTSEQNVFLLYNMDYNLIEYYSKNFISIFNMNKGIIDQKIQKERLFYQDVFTGSFGKKFYDNFQIQRNQQQNIKQRNSFSSKKEKSTLIQKTFVQQSIYFNSSSFQSPPIKQQKLLIQIYDYIYINQVKYAILQIKACQNQHKKFDSLNQPVSTPPLSQNSRVTQSLTKTPVLNLKKYQNETLFCPIQNSYQSKITQKISNLNNRGRFRFFMIMIILSCLLVVFFVSTNIYSYYQAKSRSKEYLLIEKSLTIGSQPYILIYKMYKSALKVYQAINYPDNILKSRGRSAASIINIAKNNNFKIYINTFLDKYLDTIHNQANKPISYNIEFAQFNITTSTQYSSLIDYFQNFRRFYDYSQFDFIIKNYRSFRQLTLQYQQKIQYKQKVSDKIYTSQVLSKIVLPISIFLTLLICLVSYRNQRHIKQVISIFLLIKNEQIRQKLNELKESLQILEQNDRKTTQDNIHNKDTKKIRKYKNKPSFVYNNNTNSTQSKLNHQQQDEIKDSDIENALYQYDQIDQLVGGNLIVGFLEQQQQKLNQKLRIQDDDRQGKNIKNKNNQQNNKKFVTSFKNYTKYLLYLGIVLLFGVVSFIDINIFQHEKKLIIQAFDYTKLFYDGIFAMNRLSIDAYIGAVYKHKYNQSFSLPLKNITFIDGRFQQMSQFDEINQIQLAFYNLLQTNLCQYYLMPTSAQQIPCQQYVSGILTQGYSKSFSSLIEQFQLMKDMPLKQFQSVKCTVSYCPPYYVFDYLSLKLNSVLELTYTQFQVLVVRLINDISINMMTVLIRKLVIIFGVLGILVFLIFKEVGQSDRAIEIFKIYPIRIISKMRITNYIRKNKLLDVIEVL